MVARRVIDKLADYFEANPDARISSAEAAALFRCTPHTLRQSMYELRRRGVQVRSVRVYLLRRREGISHGR